MKKRKIVPIDCYNKKVQSAEGGGIIGTVVPNFSRYGMTNGWKIAEIYETDESIRNQPDTEQQG